MKWTLLSYLNPITYIHNISDEELLAEIEKTRIFLGRQPTTTDIKNEISRFPLNTFCRHCLSYKPPKSMDEYVDHEQIFHR